MRRNILKTVLMAARVAATVGKMTAVVALVVPHTATMAYAKYDLPPPYVSKALDAVLVPINHASRHRYQIPPNLHGIYVLAVAPHGIAARHGIHPGDVLSTVRNHPILVPSDVDRLVWSALAVSVTDFLFGVARGPDIINVNTNISINNFNESININNINSWTSVENRQDWTQIVNQYNTNISTSINNNSYRSDTVINNSGIPEPAQNFDGTTRNGEDMPEPGQNFDGTRRDGAAGADVPEPGQNLDESNVSDDDDSDDSTDDSTDDGADDSTDGGADDSTDDGADDSTDEGADDSTDGGADDSTDDTTDGDSDE